jgi:uncharacterized protein (DUF1778 family)
MTKYDNINIRVPESTKKSLKQMAEARGLSLSDFILGCIADGARLEKERRERVRGLVSKMGVI